MCKKYVDPFKTYLYSRSAKYQPPKLITCFDCYKEFETEFAEQGYLKIGSLKNHECTPIPHRKKVQNFCYKYPKPLCGHGSNYTYQRTGLCQTCYPIAYTK